MTQRKSILRRLDQTAIAPLLLRIALGSLFVWMGWNKVLDPVGFLKQIHLYEMLPESPGIYMNAVAITLPWVEIVCGVALILGVYLRGASLGLAAMLVVFTPAILLRGLAIMDQTGTAFFDLKFDCGCGAGEVTTWKKLLENVSLLTACILLLMSRARRYTLALWFDRRKAKPMYCRKCGFVLVATSDASCDVCRSAGLATTVASDLSA